jgi:hypothetical protein
MSTSLSVASLSDFESDLFGSIEIDITPIKTVCLALGPYRNLTTLTASILYLHPNCQVLNHAGSRIFGNELIDFVSKYSKKKFKTFIRYAIYISQKGKRGDYGGSITLSHAFDNQYPIRDIFHKTNSGLLKQNILSLFWKESLRTSNYIRQQKVDLDRLLKLNRQLRFLLPIRNPLDCAISNLKTGKANIFADVEKDATLEQVLESILKEILWFKNLETRHPKRFFYFFEHDFNEATIRRLANFLELEPFRHWCTNALEAFDVKSRYSHSNSLMAFFRRRVENQFSNYPDFAEKLLLFAKP